MFPAESGGGGAGQTNLAISKSLVSRFQEPGFDALGSGKPSGTEPGDDAVSAGHLAGEAPPWPRRRNAFCFYSRGQTCQGSPAAGKQSEGLAWLAKWNGYGGAGAR